MDAALVERLTKYLDTLEAGLATGKDFAIEQAPLVAQEFLAWEFWRYTIGAVITFTMVFVSIWALRKYRAMMWLWEPPLGLVPILLIVIATPFFIMDSLLALKVKIAPRVVLLEEVRELVRK